MSAEGHCISFLWGLWERRQYITPGMNLGASSSSTLRWIMKHCREKRTSKQSMNHSISPSLAAHACLDPGIRKLSAVVVVGSFFPPFLFQRRSPGTIHLSPPPSTLLFLLLPLMDVFMIVLSRHLLPPSPSQVWYGKKKGIKASSPLLFQEQFRLTTLSLSPPLEEKRGLFGDVSYPKKTTHQALFSCHGRHDSPTCSGKESRQHRLKIACKVNREEEGGGSLRILAQDNHPHTPFFRCVHHRRRRRGLTKNKRWRRRRRRKRRRKALIPSSPSSSFRVAAQGEEEKGEDEEDKAPPPPPPPSPVMLMYNTSSQAAEEGKKKGGKKGGRGG